MKRSLSTLKEEECSISIFELLGEDLIFNIYINFETPCAIGLLLKISKISRYLLFIFINRYAAIEWVMQFKYNLKKFMVNHKYWDTPDHEKKYHWSANSRQSSMICEPVFFLMEPRKIVHKGREVVHTYLDICLCSDLKSVGTALTGTLYSLCNPMKYTNKVGTFEFFLRWRLVASAMYRRLWRTDSKCEYMKCMKCSNNKLDYREQEMLILKNFK
jgi:hypothetical protein